MDLDPEQLILHDFSTKNKKKSGLVGLVKQDFFCCLIIQIEYW